MTLGLGGAILLVFGQLVPWVDIIMVYIKIMLYLKYFVIVK